MKNIVLLFLILCTFPLTAGAASMDNDILLSAKNFQCTFEEENSPPLDETSEAHELYMQAREIEALNPVMQDGRIKNLTRMYNKASEMGHWKAQSEMLRRYLDGIGVNKNHARAYSLIKKLQKQNVPIGWFNWGLMLYIGGLGEDQDKEEGMRLIHKAAAMGSKDAQYMLGEYYIYNEHRDAIGLRYHVCAMRQGHGKSASAISSFLKIVDKNYPLYAEYLLRGGGLGYDSDLLVLQLLFSSNNPQTNRGFPRNAAISEYAKKHYDMLDKDPRLRFPTIGRDSPPIPKHPQLGDGRHLPSALKEACGGKWPDEAYPDLKEW